MRWSFVPSVPKLAHATVSNTARDSIDRLVWEPCHSYAVPCQGYSTSVGRHHSCHMQVSSVLQQYLADDLLLVAIDTRHHDSHHKTALPLKKGCFEINAKKIPTFAGCHLATHPISWSCGSRGIGLLGILLLVLETSQYPSGLCPEDVALLVSLDGEHPSSGHIVLRFDLPHVNEIKKPRCQPRICTQDVSLQQNACGILVLPELMLLFVHGISSWPLLLLLSHRWPYSVPARLWFDCQLLSWTSTCVLLESLVTSSRHNNRCTHGIVVTLQTSCCSPFSVVTKQNDPAAAA